MRLFIAIPLSNTAVDAIRQIQNSFRTAGVRGNYTSPENLHLTLAFIGEFGDPDLVLDAMETVEFEPFSLMMERLGRFDDLWWAGFADSPELNALVKRLRRALAEAGIPYDRKKFMPHVTILRRADIPSRSHLPQTQLKPQEMMAERVVLYCSTRGKNGMIYTELGSIPG